MTLTLTEALPFPDSAHEMPDGPFRTISQVAEALSIPQHVLRFWETRFIQIRPVKSRGGRRYYRPQDVETIRLIKEMLYDKGYTIRGVQNFLKSQRGQNGATTSPAEEMTDENAGNNLIALFDEPLLNGAPVRTLSAYEKGLMKQILLELTALQHLLVSHAREP